MKKQFLILTLLAVTGQSTVAMENEPNLKVLQGFEEISFTNGYRVIEQHGVAIIGISPGNSYFKKQLIVRLLNLTTKLFSTIYIVVPDIPSIHNYRAIGYSQAEAEREAKKILVI